MVFRYLRTRHPVHQLRDEMDRLLSGFFGELAGGSTVSRGRPPVNVWEDSDAISVELEIPGAKSEQVEVSVVENELAIKVERPELEEEGTTYHRRERGLDNISRTVRLPVEVDADNVRAELRDGVLTITLPKAEIAGARKIEVTSANH